MLTYAFREMFSDNKQTIFLISLIMLIRLTTYSIETLRYIKVITSVGKYKRKFLFLYLKLSRN